MPLLRDERCEWCNAMASRHRQAREAVVELYSETWRSNSYLWRRLHALSFRALKALDGRAPNINRPDGQHTEEEDDADANKDR